MEHLGVGRPWPYPLAPDQMGIVVDAAEDGIDILLSCTIRKPTEKEVKALTRRDVWLGLLPSPPLVWVILAGDGISFDLPFAPTLAGAALTAEQRTAASMAASWPDGIRRLLTIGVADTATGLCVGLRAVTTSKAWWVVLGDAVASITTPLDAAARQAAIDRDYRRWPSTEAMLRQAVIRELGGKA